ncbi:EF-hand domain-containing protein [Sphingomonas sp.]|uniref:EF-hand domain-containing protein n=1 Tax=Sphingomonas sp. TaxID=28214 RepID=UPI0035C7CE8F
MLKHALLAGAMIVAAPAFAQTAQPAPGTPATGSAMPAETGQVPMDGTTSQPGQTAQVPQGQTSPATATPQGAPADAAQSAQTTGSQPQAASSSQVASVIDTEFKTYDKDANGSLSKAEFAEWMNALKAKQPGGAGAMADPKWNDAAFAQADTDKSAVLSKAELTAFLSGGASQS